MRKGCGHSISGINYYGKKYYYDSGHAEKRIQCISEEIRIPCSLIRQDWTNNNIKTPYFTINKCFYRDVDVSKDSIEIERDYIDESHIAFNKEQNVIYVYVKVDEVDEGKGGGKNTTYKSTHKKVNIKNKTIIERIVYIDKNKNKYIKFNKKYELLSTFKYNRKNKYYYI